MNSRSPAVSDDRVPSGAIWPAAIIGLLLLNITIVGITVYLATTDPSVAVEPDYYEKAVKWDQSAAQAQVNRKLGWTIRVTISKGPSPQTLTVAVSDPAGNPVQDAQVEVVAFHNARSGDRQTIRPEVAGSGAYAAPISADLPGAWHFRVQVRRGSDTFTSEFDQDVRADQDGPSDAGFPGAER